MATVRERILQEIETRLNNEIWVNSVYRGLLNVNDAISNKYDYPLVCFYQGEERNIEGAYKEIKNILTVYFEVYDKTSEDNKYVDTRANELIGHFVDFIYNNARWNGLANNSIVKNNVIAYKNEGEKFFLVMFEVEIEYSYLRGRSDVRYA